MGGKHKNTYRNKDFTDIEIEILPKNPNIKSVSTKQIPAYCLSKNMTTSIVTNTIDVLKKINIFIASRCIISIL